jgi:hypothetical protein
MTSIVSRRSRTAAAIATAALAATGLAASLAARDDSSEPEWFEPIAAYYHHNPQITPQTDFGRLQFGGLEE